MQVWPILQSRCPCSGSVSPGKHQAPTVSVGDDYDQFRDVSSCLCCCAPQCSEGNTTICPTGAWRAALGLSCCAGTHSMDLIHIVSTTLGQCKLDHHRLIGLLKTQACTGFPKLHLHFHVCSCCHPFNRGLPDGGMWDTCYGYCFNNAFYFNESRLCMPCGPG